MTERTAQPTPESLARFLGKPAFQRWTHVLTRIAAAYPGVFAPDWIYGGTKHGWGLRFKKSKSFCTLIPERGRFSIQIVFGADERTQMEAARLQLCPATRKAYDAAKVFHDGKWLLLPVTSVAVIDEVFAMLAVKRRPRLAAPASSTPAQGTAFHPE